MSLKQELAANRWLRAQFAVLIFAIAWVPVAGVLSLVSGSLWALAPVPVYATAGGMCWVKSRRLGRVLKAARAATEAKAKELRTPRVPDAVPDQCPVCGGFGLDELAADDEFMERGALAKVMLYGSRRAHWDCAEVAPYEAPPHAKLTATAEHPTSMLSVDQPVDPGQYTINDVVQTVVKCSSRLPSGYYTAVLKQRLGVEASRGTELIPYTAKWPTTSHCFWCKGFEEVHDEAEHQRFLIAHLYCEDSEKRDLRRGRALSEMARERERAPRRAPCVFTTRIHEIPVEQRWAHARVCGDCMAAVVRSPTWIADRGDRMPLSESEASAERWQAANAAWCERQAARTAEETRRRWK